MEQHLLSEGPLLQNNGDLSEGGYAFSLVKKYERKLIKAPGWRIKEWDYYYIGNKDYGVALTIDDNSYMDLCSVSLLDFRTKKAIENSVVHLFSNGKRGLPEDSEQGDCAYLDKKVEMRFLHEGEKRHLLCHWKNFDKNGHDLRIDVLLIRKNPKAMVIATPFPKKGHFYYNEKINDFESVGYAKLGETFFDLSASCYGLLDWGRGVWTYRNTWYWSSLNVAQEGHLLGWNLGYGFGDTSKASENMLFVDGEAYKLEDVKFDIPMDEHGHDDYLKEWGFRSKMGDIALRFTPVLDRKGGGNALLIRSIQHQVFGTFNGIIRLPGTSKSIAFIDAPGFAEKVYNRW